MALAKRDDHHHESPHEAPTVGRPRGALWRSLQADGVVWEGQVLLVGSGVDLAARMIVTHRRVAFVRGGEIALEVPRGWLRQEPVLRRDGVLEIFVTTPESNPFDEPMKVPLRMREGHPAAGHIIAMLAPGGARRITPDTLSGIERAREASAHSTTDSFWAGLDAAPREPVSQEAPPLLRTSGEAEAADNLLLGALDPPEKLIRVSSNPARANGDASGFPIMGIAPRDQRKSPWGLFLRLAALTILLAAAAALGAGRLHLPLPLPNSNANAVLTAPTDFAAPASDGAPPAAPVAESDAPASALTPAEMTAVAIGVGGPESLEAEEVTEQSAAMPTPAAAETAAAPVEAAVAPESAAAEAPEATSAPDASLAAPDDNATAPAPAAAVTEPEAPATEPALSQQPTVDPNAPPAQEIVVGPMRLAIDTALRDESLPKYGLPPGSGDWVLLLTQVTNESDQAASAPMSEFRLYDRGTGETASLDGGTAVIAGLAGLKPALGSNDTLTINPGETADVLLLYLLPPGSSDDLALLFDQNSMELAPSLAARSAAIAAPPSLVEAAVDSVVNGAELAVTAAGQSLNVRLLGVAVPEAGACFSDESTAALESLIAGQTIWLEREATDTLADGTLARDAWISDGNGGRVLLAAELLEGGNATPNVTGPDSRYKAWLLASSALAQDQGAGLWSACPVA